MKRLEDFTIQRAGSIAVVIPAQHLLDGGGAVAVFRQQVVALKQQNRHVTLYVASPRLGCRRRSRPDLERPLAEAAKQLDADAVMIVSDSQGPFSPRAVLRVALDLWRGRWNLETDRAAADLVDTKALRSRDSTPPAAVICNYLSGIAIADALVPVERQILVLHDIIAPRLIGRVAAALRQRPHLVALTPADAERVELELPGSRCRSGLPCPQVRPVGFADLRGLATLADVLEACETSDTPADGWSRTPWARRSSLDIVFVGGAHKPNVDGLSSFVETCFLPYLAPLGVSLVVAGEVGRVLWNARTPPVGITRLGRTRNLRPLYAAARLVIVPLLEGTGVSMKTVDAAALAKPVLSTQVGLRGLAEVETFALAPPFDHRWASRILRLLASRHERRILRDGIRAGLLAATHVQALERALNAIEGRSPSIHAAPPMRPPLQMLPLVDWIGDITVPEAIATDEELSVAERSGRLLAEVTSRMVAPPDALDELVDDLVRKEQWQLATKSDVLHLRSIAPSDDAQGV